MDSEAINVNGGNGRLREASFSEAADNNTATSDVESQQPSQSDEEPNQSVNTAIHKADENTVSTFQDILTTDDANNCWILNDDEQTPFPSVNDPTEEMNELVNVCPCRCLFFTLKETICMTLSALGCAVFVAGLVFLCLFLEGSWFEQQYD